MTERRSWRVGLESSCHFRVRVREREGLARVVDLSPEGARLHFPSAEHAPQFEESFVIIAADSSTHPARAQWVTQARGGTFVGAEIEAERPLYLVPEHDPVPADEKATLEMILSVSSDALDPSQAEPTEKFNLKFDAMVIETWTGAGFEPTFSALTLDGSHRILGFVREDPTGPVHFLVDAHRTARGPRGRAVALVRMLVGVHLQKSRQSAVAAVRTATGGRGWAVAPEAAVWSLTEGDYAALGRWLVTGLHR